METDDDAVRNEDQPAPERETARNDPAAGARVAHENATPDPRTQEAG